MTLSQRAAELGAKVEAFVREVVVPYETDPRRDHHGAPTDELVMDMREKARAAGVLTPHVLPTLPSRYMLPSSGAIVLHASGPSGESPDFWRT